MKNLAFLLLFSLSTIGAFSQDNLLRDAVNEADGLRLEIKKLLDSSNVYYIKGNIIKSLAFNVELLEKALQINDPKYIHEGYRAMGYDYLVLNDSILARENFEKSAQYAKLAKNDTLIAQSEMDFANMYSGIYMDYEKAFPYHENSIALFKKLEDWKELSKAYYNAIISCFEAEQPERAFSYLTALSQYTEFQDHPFKLGMQNHWGNYYLETKDYETANTYFEQVIKEASEHEYPIELEEAYELYSESLFAQERYEESFENRKKYEETLLENLSIMQSSESESVAAKFRLNEYKKHVATAEKENQLQQEIVRSKSRLNNILIVVSVIGLFMFIGVLFAFRKRKHLVTLLKEKNQKYLEAKFRSEHLAKAKSKFFSTVSHELRTPLYGVIGLTTLLLEDKSLQKHKKDLTSLKFSADYLLALINDVLQINKIDSQSLEEDISTFHLRDLLESIAASFEYMRLQNKNTIHIEVAEDVPTLIKANSIRLSQILMNLVGNACKFTENGDIRMKVSPVQIKADAATLLFSVSDTGIGIPEDKQKSIFDEFEQVASLNYNYQGTGLGLPIVKKLLALSDSEIRLDSERGEGSTFSFALTVEVSKEIQTEEDVSLLDVSLLEGKKVLVAEDNRINQIVTKKILERNGMYCDIAENGKEVLRMIPLKKYDLVLMDLNMPELSGMEAARKIRETFTSIPIVALTAVEIEEVRNEIYESGMNDIIVKPYDVNLFLRTLIMNLGGKRHGIINNNKLKTRNAI